MLKSERQRLIWGAAAIFIATIAAYWPASENGAIWDDNYYVTENQHLHDAAGLGNIWFKVGAVPQYYPLTYTSFWIEYQIWELDLSQYHWHNILLHAMNAVLLFLLLRQLGLTQSAAWLAGAIFALHPVYVESAAWISERKNLMSTFFYLLASLSYLQFGNRSGRGNRKWYVLALFLFVCALLSKTVAASLPAAILLVIYWRRGRLKWSDVRPLLPFFAAGIAMGLMTIHVEKTHIRAGGPEWDYSLLERCLIAGRALVFYVSKLAWPANLTFIYPKWQIDTRAWQQYFYPLLVMGSVALLWLRRDKIGRGPLTAVLFFIGTLFPALGFINVFPMRYSFAADHFQYVASIGWVAMVAVFAAKRRSRLIVMVMALPLLGYLTHQQTYMYKDYQTLWRWTVDRNPSAWMAHNNLGVATSLKGDEQQAITHFRKSVELKPDHYEAISNIGSSLVELGHDDQAVAAFEHALSINNRFAPAHASLGHVLMRQRKLEKAVDHLQQAVMIKGNDAQSWHNLGVVMMWQGQMDKAIKCLGRAYEIDPENASTAHALGAAHQKMGHYKQAAGFFERAIKLKPDSAAAYHDMGMLLIRVGRLDDAIAAIKQAVRLKPDQASYHANLAVALLRAGRQGLAIDSFNRSIALDAMRAGTSRSLAWVLATVNDPALQDGPRAVTLATTAVQLAGKPDALNLDTLGAALARAGQFKQAVQQATAARQQALASGNQKLADAIAERIKLYQAGKAYSASEG